MSVTHLPNTHYTGLLSAQKNQLIGHDLNWLANLREKAAEEFSGTGFPTFREEEWRYTNISPIEKNQFTLPSKAGEVDATFIERVLLEGCHHLVFVDGFYQAEFSALNEVPDGVVISALSDSMLANEALIKSLLDSVVETPALGFINFNTAMFSDGAVISIEENA
ncbi:MAG: Fe-S cluster assembly protein SufD, partial [Cycloclasticus sp.]|nr:Fe-S cluster assembly protein SufD [Cycloclasticus sp.]